MTNNEMALMANIAVDMQEKKIDEVLDEISNKIHEQYGGCGLINDGLDISLKIINQYREAHN